MAICIGSLFIWEWRAQKALDIKLFLAVLFIGSLAYDVYWIVAFRFNWIDNYGPDANIIWKRLKTTHRIIFYVAILLAVLKAALIVFICLSESPIKLSRL